MKNSLCAYKNIFGKPREGWRKTYRFMDISYIDVLVTLLFCVIISWITQYSFLIVTLVIFLLGIFAHRIFCVRTTIDRLLFP